MLFMKCQWENTAKNKILFWRNNYCKSIITCFSNRKIYLYKEFLNL